MAGGESLHCACVYCLYVLHAQMYSKCVVFVWP